MNPTPQGGGLLASLRNLLATAIAVLQTRLELFATEVEEEKIRLAAVLWYGLVAFFFLGFGVVFLALTLTVLLWDSHRLVVLALATVLFLVVGLIALAIARRQVRAGSRLFASSLAELAQDRAAVERQQE
jgi:uncharacterized membrane protein YqjE